MILSKEKNMRLSKQPGIISMDTSTGPLIKDIREMIVEDLEINSFDRTSIQVLASGFHFYIRAENDIKAGKEILQKIMLIKSKFIGKSYDELINQEIHI